MDLLIFVYGFRAGIVICYPSKLSGLSERPTQSWWVGGFCWIPLTKSEDPIDYTSFLHWLRGQFHGQEDQEVDSKCLPSWALSFWFLLVRITQHHHKILVWVEVYNARNWKTTKLLMCAAVTSNPHLRPSAFRFPSRSLELLSSIWVYRRPAD